MSRELGILSRRVRGLVRRGTVTLREGNTKMQGLQVRGTRDEVLDGVEHWEPYGWTAAPLAGSEVLMLGAGGGRSMPIAAGVADRRYRITGLADGEVCVHDDQGQRVTLYRDRIELQRGAVKATLSDTGIVLDGNVSITGTLAVALAATLGGGGTVTGTLEADIVREASTDVRLGTHLHDGVVPGSGQTADPVEGT